MSLEITLLSSLYGRIPATKIFDFFRHRILDLREEDGFFLTHFSELLFPETNLHLLSGGRI